MASDCESLPEMCYNNQYFVLVVPILVEGGDIFEYLSSLAQIMKKQIQLKDHKYFFTTYKNSFSGKKAVSWLGLFIILVFMPF